MVRGSNVEKVREWINRFERFEKSKLTVARFCEYEGVSQPSYYHWKKKLREHPVSTRGVRQRFQPVHIAPSAPSAPSARSKAVTTVHLGPGIHIELGSDLRIVESIVRQLLKSAENNSTGAEGC